MADPIRALIGYGEVPGLSGAVPPDKKPPPSLADPSFGSISNNSRLRWLLAIYMNPAVSRVAPKDKGAGLSREAALIEAVGGRANVDDVRTLIAILADPKTDPAIRGQLQSLRAVLLIAEAEKTNKKFLETLRAVNYRTPPADSIKYKENPKLTEATVLSYAWGTTASPEERAALFAKIVGVVGSIPSRSGATSGSAAVMDMSEDPAKLGSLSGPFGVYVRVYSALRKAEFKPADSHKKAMAAMESYAARRESMSSAGKEGPFGSGLGQKERDVLDYMRGVHRQAGYSDDVVRTAAGVRMIDQLEANDKALGQHIGYISTALGSMSSDIKATKTTPAGKSRTGMAKGKMVSAQVSAPNAILGNLQGIWGDLGGSEFQQAANRAHSQMMEIYHGLRGSVDVPPAPGTLSTPAQQQQYKRLVSDWAKKAKAAMSKTGDEGLRHLLADTAAEGAAFGSAVMDSAPGGASAGLFQLPSDQQLNSLQILFPGERRRP